MVLEAYRVHKNTSHHIQTLKPHLHLARVSGRVLRASLAIAAFGVRLNSVAGFGTLWAWQHEQNRGHAQSGELIKQIQAG